MAFVPDTPSKFVPDAAPPAKSNAAELAAQEPHPIHDVIDMIRAVPSGLIPAVKGLANQVSDPYGSVADLARTLHTALSNPQATLTSVGNTLKNATPAQVGANVVAPMVVGGVLGKGAGLAAGSADATSAAAAEAASPAGQLGLRTTKPHPVATTFAGSSAGPTLDAQNRAAATTVLGADAGVPHGTPVNPTSLSAARELPGKVLDDGAASLPPAPLSPAAAAKVQAARGPATITKPTPNVANQINDIESSLLQPDAQFTGEQIRATRNSLSSDANAGVNSDDADTRAIAKYKRGVIEALDQHIADTMPPNSAISPEMMENARATLAKNYNLQDLIGKGGDIDLQKLAQDHRDNPNKFTGNSRVVAQFASDHPEVTGNATDAERIAPPSLGSDIAHINVVNPRSWIQPIFGGLARRALRGPAGASLEAAQQTPVAGLGGEFEHQPLTQLSHPQGQAFEPHQPQAATGNPQRDFFGTGADNFTASPPSAPAPATSGPPGQIPLADLLSHGVEQPPAAGLSAGPMGAPPQVGLPFVRNATHEAGGLETEAPRTYGGQPANNSDLGAVMSQGVPEGTVAKSSPSSAPQFEKLGQPLVSHDVAQDGSHIFSSPNGTTTAVRLPDGSLKVTGSTTSKVARGTGEGSARIEAAAKFAHEGGDALVSDNEVSAPEQQVYNSLKRRGLDVRENPHTTSPGTGVKKSASELKGVYEIHPPLGAALQ